ncbi:MAG TPA: 5-methyltetrahydropteroyltriglutamate--homocysteine S-methyltransferase [Burkholderiales bacterium]|nr:5-methyltetrahydropteroyltriglutamate--homocysteine S-methyltransferase [Burkholderiales bacterium]
MPAPFRADHVGSLLRPKALHEARARAKKGEITKEELRKEEDRHIRDAVKLQEEVGLQSITDGEFRRDWWHIDFLHGFEGVELAPSQYAEDAKFKGSEEQPPFMQVKSKIRRPKPSMLSHFEFLQSVLTKGTAKFTMPSPAMLHARSDRAWLKKTYPSLDEFWDDLTKAYREEIRDLYRAGCRYLQIDDTTIAMMGDPKVQAQFRSLGDEPRKDTAMYAEAINAAISDVPDDMTVCVHTCRGNFKSTWLASGSYDYVAEIAFSRIDVDGFFLEYDTERAGGFEPLRHIPQGKRVVLGLVSSKFPELEKTEELKRRIDAASKVVPKENLCISPQCGFSSTHHGNNLTEAQERAKLKLCIDTAREVWGGL